MCFFKSTAVGQAVACALVTQRARVRSPVGTSFPDDVFFRFLLTCKTCQEALGLMIPRISFGRHNHPYIGLVGMNE